MISIKIYRVIIKVNSTFIYFQISTTAVIFVYNNMHKLNVLILGPASFISTLDELKPFLKFNALSENING